MTTWYQRIRKIRNEKGMSLRDLAPLAGTDHTYLGRIETGHPSSAVTVRKVQDICKALGIEVWEVITAYENPTKSKEIG